MNLEWGERGPGQQGGMGGGNRDRASGIQHREVKIQA
jgi:hypothetical protein